MFRRSSDDPFAADPNATDDIGDLLKRADDDPQLYHVFAKIAQQAVNRRNAGTAPGPTVTSLDPLDSVQAPPAAPDPATFVDQEYEPRPATYIKASRCDQPGYVAFTANGTYAAREYLKQMLGGYWDKPRRRWLVPAHFAARAAAYIEAAELGKLPGIDPRWRPRQTTRDTERRLKPCVCWVCGEGYPEVEIRARPGARWQDYYCGCCEPGATKGTTARFRRG